MPHKNFHGLVIAYCSISGCWGIRYQIWKSRFSQRHVELGKDNTSRVGHWQLIRETGEYRF